MSDTCTLEHQEKALVLSGFSHFSSLNIGVELQKFDKLDRPLKLQSADKHWCMYINIHLVWGEQ